jgi:hypothetical protein
VESILRQASRNCLRFFELSNDKTLSIFCESGLKREWEAEIINEDTISLHVTIPLPPDELISSAGHHATQIHLEETDETFTIHSPRRLATNSHERMLYYPSKEAKLWTIFQYDLEIPIEEAPMKVEIDFESKLLEAKVNEPKGDDANQ